MDSIKVLWRPNPIPNNFDSLPKLSTTEVSSTGKIIVLLFLNTWISAELPVKLFKTATISDA